MSSDNVTPCLIDRTHIVRLDWRDTTSAQSSETCILALLGVTSAGFFYPLIAGIVLAISTLQPMVALISLVVWPVAGVFCASIISVAGTFCYTLVAMLNWSLDFRLSARTQIGLTGSLSGFVCTAWMVISAMGPRYQVPWVIYAIGPFLGTLMGQLMSVRTARKQLKVSRWVDFQNRPISTRKPLSLRNMFMITSWAAIVALTIRLLGPAGGPFAIVLLCFAIQWFLVMAAEKAWSLVPRDAQDSSSIVGKDSSASSSTS